MTEWERQREREEFSRAARAHRPLTTSLASRFTRGSGEEGKGGERGDKPEVRGRDPFPQTVLCPVTKRLGGSVASFPGLPCK